MGRNRKRQIAVASAFALLLFAGGASAQTGSDSMADAGVLAKKLAQAAQAGGGGEGSVAFSTSIVASYSKPVTGAPYSAQIVTDSVQPFADGNSIKHTTTSGVYRDSLGRTRREQNFNVVGPFQVSDKPLQFIIIDDPVAGVRYNLNPTRMTGTQFAISGTIGAASGDMLPRKVIPNDGSNVSITYFSSDDGTVAGGRGGSISVPSGQVTYGNATTESLGADTMQGLSVLGTRVTRTIPAGQIGNTLPILITTDKWYSPDLQIDVMTVHSDPRTGTTTTALVNVLRGEPKPSLFTVPPGYTISTPGNGANKAVLRKQEPL
jgi:hypothetical protein